MSVDFLPPALAERTRPLGPGAPRAGGFVLYWMRTAMRASENPALDVALLAGKRLGKPVFVYQGLSERYRFASDRHHTFILEGAREVSAALASRGIGYAFHLERPGHRRAVLRDLAVNAALVVTEDMPVAPFAAVEGFSGWDAQVAKVAPVWRVDTACVVPFRSVRSKPERAVAFRDEREPRWAAALTTPWIDVEPSGPAFVPELPFEPVSLSAIEPLVAACDIDHSIAPALHLAGGTRAAEARWLAFLNQQLGDYAKRRDDPLVGNSRLSPWLHYGMISAFKVARDAHAHRTEGAAKFLDELLVWRELAWAFCALEPRHATVAALPAWAQSTLRIHEGDGRVRHGYETLARAQTGDPLWDAAQRSLLMRGELHNSVRMTWGKAVLGWSRDAAEAMAVLIDLNHRYALDGRDPASYLGILYCLGAFDRPFAPEVPVLGAVRPPPPTQRFEVSEYVQRTRRPARGQPLTVAIVGAGIAGAACARALADAGQEVTLYEEAPEPGGRCVAAPFFTATDRRFLRWLGAWVDEGTATRDGSRFSGGAAIIRRMLHGLDVRSGAKVSSVQRHQERWRLVAASGAGQGEYDAVVVTAPAPLTQALLDWSAPGLAARAAEAIVDPQWVATLTLPEAVFGDEVLEVRVGSLRRIVRRPDGWRLEASAAWSRKHLADAPALVASALLDAFWATTGARPQHPVELSARLWPHARVAKPVGVACLFDPALWLAAAGDWCLGDGVEAAFLSGSAAAGRLNALRGQASPEPALPPLGVSQLRLF